MVHITLLKISIHHHSYLEKDIFNCPFIDTTVSAICQILRPCLCYIGFLVLVWQLLIQSGIQFHQRIREIGRDHQCHRNNRRVSTLFSVNLKINTRRVKTQHWFVFWSLLQCLCLQHGVASSLWLSVSIALITPTSDFTADNNTEFDNSKKLSPVRFLLFYYFAVVSVLFWRKFLRLCPLVLLHARQRSVFVKIY